MTDELCRGVAQKSSSCGINCWSSHSNSWIRLRKSSLSKVQYDTIQYWRLTRSLQPDGVHSCTNKSKSEEETFMKYSNKLFAISKPDAEIHIQRNYKLGRRVNLQNGDILKRSDCYNTTNFWHWFQKRSRKHIELKYWEWYRSGSSKCIYLH